MLCLGVIPISADILCSTVLSVILFLQQHTVEAYLVDWLFQRIIVIH